MGNLPVAIYETHAETDPKDDLRNRQGTLHLKDWSSLDSNTRAMPRNHFDAEEFQNRDWTRIELVPAAQTCRRPRAVGVFHARGWVTRSRVDSLATRPISIVVGGATSVREQEMFARFDGDEQA